MASMPVAMAFEPVVMTFKNVKRDHNIVTYLIAHWDLHLKQAYLNVETLLSYLEAMYDVESGM